jgi:RES domain-containing protein
VSGGEWEQRWRGTRRVSRLARHGHAGTLDDAVSGAGGLQAGGRWHRRGRPVVYTAASRSAAILERMVHLEGGIDDAGPDLVFFDLVLPPEVSRRFLPPRKLDALVARQDRPGIPPDWRAPDHPVCRGIGDAWLASGTSCLLVVPSAVEPSEANFILNPRHPDMRIVREANAGIFRTEPYRWDARLAEVVDLAAFGRRARSGSSG